MKTRKQYLNEEISHREYYGQFVNGAVKSLVLRCIGRDKIKNSANEHFNDISLSNWDSLVSSLPHFCVEQLKIAGDYMTLAVGVCILKEAAKQIKES